VRDFSGCSQAVHKLTEIWIPLATCESMYH